jgi:arabinose-5-phosphate isomerase
MTDTTDQTLSFARSVIDAEARAVASLANASLDEHFTRAARLILDCPASVLTSGIGKAGHIARKLAATLASTGTPSHFLSPADAVHGDLGAVRSGDVVLILSASGESDEILRMLSILKKLNHTVLAITCTRTNTLARAADVTLTMGRIDEACPLGLAPSASTTAMLALGDALALTVMKLRNFTPEDFFLYHPAGQLGRKLTRVREAMTFRKGDNLPLFHESISLPDMLHQRARIQRPPGAVLLHDDAGRLSGIFTDGDLRRLITTDPASVPTTRLRDVMKRGPRTILADALASDAMAIMRPLRIDELPVVDDHNNPIGLIDIQDLVVLKMLDVDPNPQ